MNMIAERVEIPREPEDSEAPKPLFPVAQFPQLKEWLYSHDSRNLNPVQLDSNMEYVKRLSERLEDMEGELEARADEYRKIATPEELEEFKVHLPSIRRSIETIRGGILVEKHSR